MTISTGVYKYSCVTKLYLFVRGYKNVGDRNGLLVLSEIWYPEGWTATIDGLEVPLVRANYILRALPIEAGDHEVVLSFESPGARRAGLVGGLGSIGLILFMAFAGFKCCRA